ncbi:class I SAM-dependent methyltransferase [Ramlibacter sp.]|uniref:class I SAM-dependent methyltransferase n=1 Tax=Ramlibacter sp. TaxID=1917967 RepID=UPI002BE38EE4|nr:methyltransferase domain-containing protein [Ramlibacter sp.]HWI81556.1 methyltransferase domain-containing protein [Ramlibacter sp.]
MAQHSSADRWERGSPYERYVGRWSRQLAPRFLDWLDVPHGKRWLDVGCGTGALTAAILERCAPAAVFGVEPSEGFLTAAGEQLAGAVTLHQGTATAIPLPDAAVDVVVSGLVLNFVPDQPAALREMARVSGPGGLIAAYVWDYAGRMELMRQFWDAAAALDPAAADLDEGVRFPVCRPAALEKLFVGSGLAAVEVTGLEIATPFKDFDDYWQPFLGGQGPAPAYAMSLDEPARGRLRDRLRSRLPVAADGSIALAARAWAARGVVPAAA